MVRVGDCTSALAIAYRAGNIGPAAELHAHEHLGGIVSLLGQIHDRRVKGDQADPDGRQAFEDARHHRAMDHRVHHRPATVNGHDDVPGKMMLDPREEE